MKNQFAHSLLKRQCLSDRVESIEKLNAYVTTYIREWNSHRKTVNWQFKTWQFKTVDDRIKLRPLYPEL